MCAVFDMYSYFNEKVYFIEVTTSSGQRLIKQPQVDRDNWLGQVADLLCACLSTAVTSAVTAAIMSPLGPEVWGKHQFPCVYHSIFWRSPGRHLPLGPVLFVQTLVICQLLPVKTLCALEA